MKLRTANDMPINEYLARRFDRVGDDFIECHKVEGLSADNLNFSDDSWTVIGNGSVADKAEDVWACDTQCCHGGWGAVMYLPKFNPSLQSYTSGADAIARELGFEDRFEFKGWANRLRVLWGYPRGYEMFDGDGFVAFGYANAREMTLADIGKHYKGVAKRIRKQIAK